MSRTDAIITMRSISFPRVSGDEPFLSVIGRDTVVFSPRERG